MEWEKLCHFQKIQPATVYPLKVNIHIPSLCRFYSSSSRPLRLMHQFEVWDLIIYTRSTGRWSSWSIVPRYGSLKAFSLFFFLWVEEIGISPHPLSFTNSKWWETHRNHCHTHSRSSKQQFYNVAELGTCWEVWMRNSFIFKLSNFWLLYIHIFDVLKKWKYCWCTILFKLQVFNIVIHEF